MIEKEKREYLRGVYDGWSACHRKVRMATYDLRTWAQGKKESGE